MRLIGIPAVGVLCLIAACGAGSGAPIATSGTHPPTASATPARATIASATSSAAPTSTPAAPSPTPAPPQPLVVIGESPSGGSLDDEVIAVVSADGTPQWALDHATLARLAAPGSPFTWTAAGSHLIGYGDGRVVVINRSGILIGRGSYTSGAGSQSPSATIYPDPTGRRWAWAVLDASPEPAPGLPDSTVRWTSSVWVAGVGEAPHRVRTWTQPYQTSVDVYQWSDEGVVTAVVPASCGGSETSTALLDPATGGTAPLYGSDRHLTDVHAGLRVGFATPTSPDRETILIAGRVTLTVSETPLIQGEHVVGVRISPSGARVEGTLFAESGCGGTMEARTVVIDVVTGQSTILPGVFAWGWVDDTHLAAWSVTAAATLDNHVRVVDLSGPGPAVGRGHFVGVLAP